MSETKEPTAKLKLCKDCWFFQDPYGTAAMAICRNPKAAVVTLDLLYGDELRTPAPAMHARTTTGSCGSEARLFEPAKEA